MHARAPSAAHLEQLLDLIIAQPERGEELTAELHAKFSRRKAILVLDMCGFSRTTQQRGIVTFLLMIRRMRLICEPCFGEHGGELLKAEADNLLYSFDSAAEAVAAAREAHRRIADANDLHPADDHLFCAIGIGFGEVLWIAPDEMHGQELNLASKLGEDIARDGQTLLTTGARAAIDAMLPTRETTVLISGLELTYHELITAEEEL